MAQKSKRKSTSKRKSAKKTPRTQARAKTAAPSSGPVTLAEARKLAQKQQPKLAVRKATTTEPTPEAVGAERKSSSEGDAMSSRAAFANTRPRWRS